MEFVQVLGEQRVDLEEDEEVVAEMTLSRDEYGWRLLIKFTDRRKPWRIIRLTP